MIISKEKIEKIRQIIKNHFNYLVLKIAGNERLSSKELSDLKQSGLFTEEEVGIIQDAYYVGNLRNGMFPPDKRPDISLAQFTRQYNPQLINLTDREQFAIDHVKSEIGNFITALGVTTATTVENIIGNANIEFRNKILDEQIRPIIAEGIAKQKTIAQIASDLRNATGDLFRNWKRVSSNELSRAMTLGEIDAIKKRNKNKTSEEIRVVVVPVRDNALCVFCRRLYLRPNGKPKVFKLSELVNNGTNYGVKPDNYLPVVPPNHVNCRCNLNELVPGSTFDEDGNISYRGEDYDEYTEQNKK